MSHYPEDPGYKRPGTSEEAAESIVNEAQTIRERVYVALATQPATADEMADLLGLDKLSVRPRFSELDRASRIEDSGLRRRNRSGKRAIVWRQKVIIDESGQSPLF